MSGMRTNDWKKRDSGSERSSCEQITESEQILYGQCRPRGQGLAEELAVADTDSLRHYLRNQPKLKDIGFDLDDLYLDQVLVGEPPAPALLERLGLDDEAGLDPEFFSPNVQAKIITDVIAAAGEDEYGVVLTTLYRHLCPWVIGGDQQYKQTIVRHVSSVHNYQALGDLARRVYALTHER